MPTFPVRPPGGICGLDLARRVGWAYCVPGGEHAAGEWELPEVSRWGAQGNALANALWDLIEAYAPRWVGIEAPLSISTDTEENYRSAFGMAAVAAMTFDQAGIQPNFVKPSTVRATVLRDGHIPGKIVKSVVIRWARDQGWAVPGNDAADAVAVREYEAWRVRQKGAHSETPWNGKRFWRAGELV